MKIKNDKLEGEIISVRNAVDNWRSGVNNMKDQILDEVKRGIEKNSGKIKLEQDAIEHDVLIMKVQILGKKRLGSTPLKLFGLQILLDHDIFYTTLFLYNDFLDP